jgi:uncharacterized protein (TIGR02266 family)
VTASSDAVVLVAASDVTVRNRFARTIAEAGYQTVEAASAAALLDGLGSMPAPGLALIDLRLGDSPGVDIVRSARRQSTGLQVLVFAGSVANAEEVRQLAALEVAGYVNEHTAIDRILPVVAPHLHPDGFDRRAGSRAPLVAPVSYRSGSQAGTATTIDLGRGGLAIRTMTPLAPASAATVRFELPGGLVVEADARVIWSSGRTGMGLQFERLDPDAQAAIDDFVSRAAAHPRLSAPAS